LEAWGPLEKAELGEMESVEDNGKNKEAKGKR
jgi:hypothetical protein